MPFTNTIARAATIALIEGAKVFSRQRRGGLMCPSANVGKQRRALATYGSRSMVIIDMLPDAFDKTDMIRFYDASGIITHEEPLSAEMLTWFDAQSARL